MRRFFNKNAVFHSSFKIRAGKRLFLSLNNPLKMQGILQNFSQFRRFPFSHIENPAFFALVFV